MAKRKTTPFDPALNGEDIPDVGLVLPPGESLPVEEPAVVRAKRPIRREDIPQGVDPFRYVREHGYTNPTRKYRVTPQAKPELAAKLRSLEIEAVDESEAINKYVDAFKIPTKLVYGMTFKAIAVEG